MPIRGGDSVDIVDVTAGKIVKNLPVKAPHNCYNAQRNDHVWVTSMGDHKVNLIDLKTLTYLAEIPVGGIRAPGRDCAMRRPCTVDCPTCTASSSPTCRAARSSRRWSCRRCRPA